MMEVIITAKHSNVFYVYKKSGEEYVFEAVEKAAAVKNDFGLDLFRHKNDIYEGRTGFRLFLETEIPNLAKIIEANGGLEGFNARIEKQVSKTGESPRYSRPDERKKDVFPPDPEKENTVFAKGIDGKKHYYNRFYNENGIELYLMKSKSNNDFYQSVYVPCEGYMVGVGQYHHQHNNLDTVLKFLAGFENGLKGEIERLFNESLENPQKWADPFFAEILGRVDEAKAHNAPIREARERENRQRDAEREAKRIATEQAEKAEYEKAIKTTESKILNKETVLNDDIHDKSLIMQLFREHNINVPLKTQGWIINALHDIHYDENKERWSYQYYNKSSDSTVFFDYLPLLVSAVQTKQQFEEMTQNGEDEPPTDNFTEEENEDDMEI